MNNIISRVRIRETDCLRDIIVTSSSKPEIPVGIVEKWQRILNATADIMDVPTALIMKLDTTHITVFLKNTASENPFNVGDSKNLGDGLYCETVAGKDDILLVKNALEDNTWRENHAVELNMISYLGMPIKWDDEENFGTICVMDNKENSYNSKYINLLKLFRENIEADLKLLTVNQKLEDFSKTDSLTGLPNRKGLDELILLEFAKAKRYTRHLSLILLNIDGFKDINDLFGHLEGDKVLIRVSSLLADRLRKSDIVGRWGSDEFLIICPETELENTTPIAEDLRMALKALLNYSQLKSSASFGVSAYKITDKKVDDILLRLDRLLLKVKNTGKNRVNAG
jgi:diguanylate cyclase (GGDEF)-like protein